MPALTQDALGHRGQASTLRATGTDTSGWGAGQVRMYRRRPQSDNRRRAIAGRHEQDSNATPR